MSKPKESAIKRFLRKVRKTPHCWVWQGAIASNYGRFWDGDRVDNAHRFSYNHYIGKIPKGYSVCHKCDNPKCVNPKHLFLGTQKDNLTDMRNKKRHRKIETYKSGEHHCNSKLTGVQVKKIKKLYATKTYNSYELGRMYSVHRTCINRVIKGETYANVK